jgi:DNA repair exonuclease SbcCD nuclease subunit
MKIAHISDLHLCRKYKRDNVYKIKKILQQIVESEVDHIVISGDLTDNADEKDYLVLRRILESYNLLRWNKTSIVIGNHDIFGGVQSADDIINFPSKCKKVNYKEKVENFVKYFEELFENVFLPLEANPFPYAKEIGNVVLIGINSIDQYSKIKNPFASNGLVSKEQKKGLIKILEIYNQLDKLKIAIIHHHFNKNNVPSFSSENYLWNSIENFTMKLREKKKLMKLFVKNGITLVLHGHSHEMSEYMRRGLKFVNSGGSIDNKKNKEVGYFLINVDGFDFNINMKKFFIEKNITVEQDSLINY